MANFDTVVAGSRAYSATFDSLINNSGCSKVRLVVMVTGGGGGQFTPIIEFMDSQGLHHELLEGAPFAGNGEYRYQVGPGFEEIEGLSADDFVSKQTNFRFRCDYGSLTFQASAQFND